MIVWTIIRYMCRKIHRIRKAFKKTSLKESLELEKAKSILSSNTISRFFAPDVVDEYTTNDSQHEDGNMKKIVILFHAGNECASDYYTEDAPETCILRNLLMELGFTVIIPNYLTKNFNIINTLDVFIPELVQKMKNSHNPQDIIVFGRGVLGSLLASEFISRFHDVSALVLESPACEVGSLICSDKEITKSFSGDLDVLRNALEAHCNNTKKISKYKGPLILLHSDADQKIPASHSDNLMNSSFSRRKNLFLFNSPEEGKLIISNLDLYLSALTTLCHVVSHEIPDSFENLVQQIKDGDHNLITNTSCAEDLLTEELGMTFGTIDNAVEIINY
ncbi:ABHD16A [Acrasis kona]|uniref:ABHD16A n=1 Tax=Acrasis kona TaxID=1008807 RepID=A0AAW2Z3H7_9EUKA